MFENKTSVIPFAQTESPGDTNILLAILPFWNPLIPPMGISCLKSYLQPHGYQVKTIDANIEFQFREVYDDYFNALHQYIPGHKKGNFYNIGNDVLQNHMMAHLNYEDEKEYVNLVKILVYQTFFYHIDDSQAEKLNKIIHEFYTRLEKYVLKLLETEKPAVLGLSVYRATAAASLFAFKLAKANYPHIKTVMGGGIFAGELSLGSPNLDFFLKHTPFIDKIIVGEGEELFLRFLQNKLPQTQRVYTPKDLDHRVLALDTLKIPDFSDFDTRYYPVLAAYASRSCPFQCTFCAEKVLWGKYRKKNARHIAEEMVQASKKYNCQLFLMTDSLLNPVIKELSSELLKIGDSIYWDGYLRADQAACDPESTFQWRRCGFYRARLGLESGSQRILAAMKKNITPHQIKEAVTSLAHAGIKTTTYWLIGYPGETEDDFQQTLELITELKNDIYEADCNPFSYFLTGQVASDGWREKNQSTLLFPESARDMLIIQTWIMAGEPSREETYQRIIRFVNHCKKLGIPNPYSLQEIYQADERWKKLHKNAVPSLVELMEARNNQTRYLDENKKSKSWSVDRTPSSMMGDGERRTTVTMKTTNYSKKIAFTVSQDVKERDYWLNQLSGKLTKTCFPRDLKKTTGNDDESPKKDAVRFQLQGDLFSRLIHLSNHSDFRLHIIMVTGIIALLYKYTGSRDILLGTPIYKQEVRGELINTVLALRNRVNNGMTFKDLLLQVGQTILEANENQNYPIETLLYQLNLPVLPDECPLFDAAVLLENIHDKSYLQPVNPAVIFSFLRTGECIQGVVEYQPLLFDQTTIEIIIGHFTVLLQQAITHINCSLPGINILSQQEKTRLLMDFNDNITAFPKDKTIFHFIEKYADTAPERAAILFEGTEVSHRSLNQRANRLARLLRERGIRADEPVGILLNRSPRMAESILAVWKAGGTYIPMDPDYPVKRIIEILKDSHAKILLTGTNYIKKELASACKHKIIDLDQYANEIEKQDFSNPGIDINMKGLAYIIYTSGSTGKPKGVMVEHIGMMNHIYAKINDLHLSGKSVVAQNASHTFDISVWQFFTALILGGKIVIYPNQLVLEPVRFVHRVIQDRVTILEVVPSYLSVMLETLEPGKIPFLDYLLVTGEALKQDLVKQWFKRFPGIRMVNAYGPTEASDDITHHIIDKPPAADRVPIGKPVQNLTIYIVDEHMQLCPLRVKGEICVSGVGVGRGYLNNPELTSERFINNKIQNTMPLSIKKAGAKSITNYNVQNYKPNGIHASMQSSTHAIMQSCNHTSMHPITPLPHSPIYRTGDMGSWLPDGTIEFFGRKDSQVKIRGFRIELGEIETQLEMHSNVKEAVVVDREDEKGNKYLCAYLVTRGTLSVPGIKAYLSERLPHYMVPDHFMGLEKMPLTSNGKIDRKALPEPVGEVTAANPYITYITEEMLRNVEIPREEMSGSKVLMEQEINQNQQHILTDKEKHQVLYTFNDTKTDYPKDKTLHQLFEAQVEKIPHRTALVYEDRWITYRELNRRTNRLARFLQARGLEIGGIAGLLMDRSIEMFVSILAILKTGGAYLPLDAETPKNRTISMLEDCQATMILTTSSDIADYSFIQLQSFQQSEANPYLAPPRAQITQLDELPFPNRSLVDYEKYSQYIGQALVKNSIALLATRGCPFKCTFCHKIWPKTHMVRSAENLFAEVRKLYNLGIRRFSFVDDVFNFNKKNSARFFQLIIENGLDLQLFFPNGMRGDILTKDYIDLMVKAGAVSIALALETASPRLQKLIGKNLDIERLRENLCYFCEKYPHVILELFTMHGFPTESQEEAQMTLDFLKRIKWVHFPYLAILKIYPKTDMEKLALTHGISREAIDRSASLAAHELSETLPFDKKFTLKYQTEFLHDYFLLKERLLHVLPFQMKVLTEDEIIQKYNSYLPVEIKSFDDLLEFVNISTEELWMKSCLEHDCFMVPHLNEKIRQAFPGEKPAANAFRVLLLDLSLYFTADSGDMLYDISSPPLGLMYLMTYLKREYGPRINGKVAKSRMDFDNFEELKRLVKDFNPNVIGIRSLTFFRDFFHKTAAMLRNWGIEVPIIAGGPYATSEFETILQDRNIDLVVRGEGEVTFNQLIGEILENGGRLPDEAVLRNIRGLTFIPGKFERTAQLEWNVILVDQYNDNQSQPEKADINLELPVQPSHLAYVIFTSGSTGKPKGVMIENRSVVNFIKGMTNIIDFTANDVILSLVTISFDIFVLEALLPLTRGSRVVISNMEQQLDTRAATRLINREQITIFQGTPSMVQWLTADSQCTWGLKGLKNLIVGGEIFPEALLERLKKIVGGRIFNVYGPTETTVWSTAKNVSGQEKLNIGKPIANTQIYIRDRSGEVLPIGVTGELCIGGHGVARGYLNRPELTVEKFVEQVTGAGDRCRWETNSNKKFLRMFHGTGAVFIKRAPGRRRQKLYRTGDLARWLPDGNIEFLGRRDHQVKIRGLRIELGEIESLLLEYQWITEAVVVVKEHKGSGINDVDRGDKYLCAYFVAGKPILEAELREHLSGQLPPYLIPSSFARLEKMPLTPNGKLNRRLLQVLDVRTGSEIKKQGPNDEIEKKMVELWSSILGIHEENIGIEDNFFQLGGHSLKVTVLVARIHKEFHVNIPLVKIFAEPTVKELSQYIRRAAEDKHASIEAVEKKEYYPLSSAQKRLYVLQQTDPNSVGYNMTGVYSLEGEIEKEKVENTFRQLITRHESLRTSFVLLEGKPVQKIHEEVVFSIEYDEAAEEKVDGLLETLVRPFDLSQVPLLRFGWIKISESKHVVMLDMHHIISDGVSSHIFVSDLTALLEGKTPTPLRLQYKDFSQWQNRLIESGKLKQQEEYWLKTFSGEIPVLNLPTDYVRPVAQSFEGSGVSFTIDTDEAAALKELVLKEGCTLFMVLLSAFSILLAKLCGQADIVIGTPIGGRRHADLDNIIGMFVNILTLRTKPFKEKTFKTFLPEVKELVLQAYESQDYQFEELVKKVTVNRDASRNPVFDVAFSHQNIPMKKLEVSSLELKPYPYDTRITNFDLTLYSLELEKSVELTFGYCSKLFKNETIQRFIGYFKRIVTAVLRQPEKKISQLEILSEKEKHKLLYDFNDTKARYPENKTIHQLLEEQADKNPGASAVVEVGVKPTTAAGTKQFTYKTLNEQSNRVARLLREKGIEADGIVGVMMERSLEIIISLMGILKGGGAYLPISPACPKERLKFMLTDSGSELLLTTRGLVKETGFENKTIYIDEKDVYSGDAHNPENAGTSTDLAYIIYTSGTTGKPKGVMMQHKSVNNLLCGLKNTIYKNYGNHLRVCIVAPFEFDASLQQLAGALLQGHCLYIVPEETRVDGAALLEFYGKYNINISDGTPTHIRMLLEIIEGKIYLPFIKHFIIAGEELPREVTRDFLSRFQENIPGISNLYGPTETCVDSTFYHISNETIEMFHTIPIGKPLPNEQAYIVDKEIKLQPIGIAGELYIGGDGVARGYLNRPELTAEKFCLRRPGGRRLAHGALRTADPRTPCKNFLSEGTRGLAPLLYRTGDQARWLADGNIEFLGRIDHQVKIRGFRIELGEIEIQLRRHERIKDAVVVAKEDAAGDKSICAYYVENARKPIELWPSVGEYSVWDELLYQAMTHDEYRNISYKVAINRLVQDKTVVEIGTGPDVILARFCIEAGARKVYAVEILEESYKKAKETVKQLGLEEKIILIHGDAANVQLPEKVDVCLSQIIGNIASSEGAIHILNNARRFLKEDGSMIPTTCQTKIAAVQLPKEIHENPRFSEIPQIYADKIFKTYGYHFDFRICINNFPKSNIISNRETFENLNFSNTIAVENTQKVKLTINRNARLDGFLLWINLYTIEDEVIDTSKNKYVWSPVYIPVFYPGIDVSAGDTVQAECIRSVSNNNIYPDYKIKGVLIFKDGEKLEFQYDLPYLETGYQKKPFYTKLFNTDSIDVKENRHTGISAGELKEYLRRELPDYLIPSYFVKLEEIPLLPNGKVNRKALSKININVVAALEFVTPRNNREKIIAGCWKQVLKLDKVGINNNFFDVGGNSINILTLSIELQRLLGRKIPIARLFQYPTIASFAKYLDTEKNNNPKDTPRKDKKEKERRSAQNRLKQRKERIPTRPGEPV